MQAALFCGTRYGVDSNILHDIIYSLDFKTIIIHGDAAGVDSQVNSMAQERGMTIIPCPAQWKVYGKSAGPKRNTEMLNMLIALRNVGYECKVYAYPKKDSRGTNDMIAQARIARFHVMGKIIR